MTNSISDPRDVPPSGEVDSSDDAQNPVRTGKVAILLPTYNERENIEDLIRAILGLGIEDIEIVVADDNSPDGTGRYAEELSRTDPRIVPLVRTENPGRGVAGIAGFIMALERGADYLVEMDADFSHASSVIPHLLAPLQEGRADLSVGSRFVKGGRDLDRPFVRKLVTEVARRYVRITLGLPMEDVTSGYRAFTRAALQAIESETMISVGPSIVEEVYFRVSRKGLRIMEYPIVFEDRKRGESNLTFGKLIQVLTFVIGLRFRGW